MAESVEIKRDPLSPILRDRLEQIAALARNHTNCPASVIVSGPSITQRLVLSGTLAGLDLSDSLIATVFQQSAPDDTRAIDVASVGTVRAQVQSDGSKPHVEQVDVSVASVAIPTDDDGGLGMLCVVDRKTRTWSGADLAALDHLARSLGASIGNGPDIVTGDAAARNSRQASALQIEKPAEGMLAGPSISVRQDVRTSSDDLKFQTRSPRILVVDDLDLNRRLIADMLSLEGYDIDCANDGADAVRAVQDYRYDLVLMDMLMPGMDGLEATRAIRALPPPACDVAIVALTAHAFQEQLDSCLAAGMDATITKPMSMDALTATVRSWTYGRSQAA